MIVNNFNIEFSATKVREWADRLPQLARKAAWLDTRLDQRKSVTYLPTNFVNKICPYYLLSCCWRRIKPDR